MKCPGQNSRYWKPERFLKNPVPSVAILWNSLKMTPPEMPQCGHSVCQIHNWISGVLPIANLPNSASATCRQNFWQEKEDCSRPRAIEMKRYFKTDFRRIGHATRVARYAERIAKREVGNMAVILCAAYLHDIGIQESERKHQSTAPEHQEQEGPPIARALLEKLGAKDTLIDEVCDIIGHDHHPRADDTINFKVLYDADMITNMEERHKENPVDPVHIENLIETSLLTEGGKEEAEKVFSIS